MKSNLSVRLLLTLITLGMVCSDLKASQDDDLKEACKTVPDCNALINQASEDLRLLKAMKEHELWLSLRQGNVPNITPATVRYNGWFQQYEGLQFLYRLDSLRECENRNSHVPTVREIAMFAVKMSEGFGPKRGAQILEVDVVQKDFNGYVPEDFKLIEYSSSMIFYTGESKPDDRFYFRAAKGYIPWKPFRGFDHPEVGWRSDSYSYYFRPADRYVSRETWTWDSKSGRFNRYIEPVHPEYSRYLPQPRAVFCAEGRITPNPFPQHLARAARQGTVICKDMEQCTYIVNTATKLRDKYVNAHMKSK